MISRQSVLNKTITVCEEYIPFYSNEYSNIGDEVVEKSTRIQMMHVQLKAMGFTDNVERILLLKQPEVTTIEDALDFLIPNETALMAHKFVTPSLSSAASGVNDYCYKCLQKRQNQRDRNMNIDSERASFKPALSIRSSYRSKNQSIYHTSQFDTEQYENNVVALPNGNLFVNRQLR